jgi:hypothetical protein
MVCVCVDWIGMTMDGGMWTAPVKPGNEPLGSIKCWELSCGCTAGGLSRVLSNSELVRYCFFTTTTASVV